MKEFQPIEYEEALGLTGDLGGTEISQGTIFSYEPEIREEKVNALKAFTTNHKKTLVLFGGISGAAIAIPFIVVGVRSMVDHLRNRKNIEIVESEENIPIQNNE